MGMLCITLAKERIFMMRLFIGWCILFSFIGFCSMGIDKRKARLGKWRIPERTLFLIAILGGSPGSIAGMYLFHHKTRHPSFRYGLPLIFFLEFGAVCMLCRLRFPA